MDNKLETIGFLSTLREVLDLNVSSMEGISEDEKNSLQKFVMAEATDYEIVHFVTTGKFPEEKYNLENETVCMEIIKDELNSNYFDLSEIMGEEGVDSLIESLEPLSAYGLSSNTTVLEHLIDSGLMPSLVERGPLELSATEKAKAKAKGVAAGEKAIKKREEKLGAGVEDSTVNWRDTAGNSLYQAKSAAKKKIKQYQDNKAKKKREALGAGYEDTTVSKKDISANKKYQEKSAAEKKKREALGAGYEDTTVGVGDVVGNKVYQAKKEAGSGIEFVRKLSNSTQAIGGTILAAGILYGAYKTYKRFFSKAARACSGKTGAARDACVTNFKKNAVKAQISDLRKSASACKSTKSPQKCQASVNAKIQKLQAKL